MFHAYHFLSCWASYRCRSHDEKNRAEQALDLSYMKAMKRWAGCDLWKAVETLDVIEFYESITKAGQVSVVNIMAHEVLKWYKNLHNHIRKHPLVYQRFGIVSRFRLLTGLLELNTYNNGFYGNMHIIWHTLHHLALLGVTWHNCETWHNLV